MAYIVFDITCITSLATTEPTGPGGLMFYGAKFGLTGYWIRIPRVAPAIGECCTTTPALSGATLYGDSWGLYYYYGTSSAAYSVPGVAPWCPGGCMSVKAFEKGGRWIMIAPDGGDTDSLDANGVDNWHSQLRVNDKGKRLEFYYRSVAECGKPVQSTL